MSDMTNQTISGVTNNHYLDEEIVEEEEECENCYSTVKKTICVICSRPICDDCGIEPCEFDDRFVFLSYSRCPLFLMNSSIEISEQLMINHRNFCWICPKYRYCSDCIAELAEERRVHFGKLKCDYCDNPYKQLNSCTCHISKKMESSSASYRTHYLCTGFLCTGCRGLTCLDCWFYNDWHNISNRYGLCQKCVQKRSTINEELLAVYYSPDNPQLWTWQREIAN